MIYNHGFFKCGIVILLPLIQLIIDLCWKSQRFPKHGENTIKKISVKTSTAKPLGKPLPGDKNMGLEPEIYLYTLEDSDDNTEGEEA